MIDIDLTDLNIVLGALGALLVLYGFISVKIKQVWYLGVALPAVIMGIVLGPVAAKFIVTDRWGNGAKGQTPEITLGVMRVMIGLQLVIAGYQLPAKYFWTRWKEMAMCLLPIMTMMWLATTVCVLVTTTKLNFLPALVVSACVTCTDPVLSQAIAKGPFADMFVARPLREIISCEAGANDGFGFPFLMIAVYMMRHAYDTGAKGVSAESSMSEDGVGRLGGGVGVALRQWFLETWLYMIFVSVIYGAMVGYLSCKVIRFCLRRRWVDNESYLLFPSALGMFLIGTCGAIGLDDSLACFVAGSALNWDGHYLKESERRHDEVNSTITELLNFGGFFYLGAVMPWAEFNDPDGTGITIGRLFVLGVLVILFRRIPAVLAVHKLMKPVCANWKEALFMGYFGPIGAGAIFYTEYAKDLFPEVGKGDEEETHLRLILTPVVYWLVFFSVIVHGLSIPALNIMYHYLGVQPIHDDGVEVHFSSKREALPANAMPSGGDRFIAYNRFSRPAPKRVTQWPSISDSRRSSNSTLASTEDDDIELGYKKHMKIQHFI